MQVCHQMCHVLKGRAGILPSTLTLHLHDVQGVHAYNVRSLVMSTGLYKDCLSIAGGGDEGMVFLP